MIREIIRPQGKTYTINIPEEYINKEVEIIMLPVRLERIHLEQRADIVRKTSGILSDKKIDPVSWQREIRSEWDNRI